MPSLQRARYTRDHDSTLHVSSRVTAIDLRECLRLEKRPGDKPPMNVVVYTSDGAISLLVDEVGDVVEVLPGDFEAVPQTLSGPASDVIEGVYKLADCLLLVVNVERTSSLASQISTRTDSRNGRIIHAGA